MLQDRGLVNVLYDVVPKVEFDYLSYSSYESLDSPNPPVSLRADLDLIRSLTGTDRIIIGEFGFPRSGAGQGQIALIRAVTEAAIGWGVPYIFQWNLYDQDGANDFGLFDLNGNITPLGSYYQHLFSLPPDHREHLR